MKIKENEKCARNMTSHGILIIIDKLTNLIIEDNFPLTIRSINENIEMYRRHFNSEIIDFDIKLIGPREKSYVFYEREYRPNSFNSFLKTHKESFTVISKDPDDPKDAPWIITFNHDSQEKMWVKMMYDTYSDKAYKLSTLSPNLHLHKVFGSLCHRGFINQLFNCNHRSNMNVIRDYIVIIGNNKEKLFENIEKIEQNYKETNYHSDTIYKCNLYTNDVKMLCEYCEEMFEISRYEIARHFKKREPNYFIEQIKETNDNITNQYLVFRAAAIHAENSEYESALKMMHEGIEQYPYRGGRSAELIKNYIKYYEENGTSILSSL